MYDIFYVFEYIEYLDGIKVILEPVKTLAPDIIPITFLQKCASPVFVAFWQVLICGLEKEESYTFS